MRFLRQSLVGRRNPPRTFGVLLLLLLLFVVYLFSENDEAHTHNSYIREGEVEALVREEKE